MRVLVADRNALLLECISRTFAHRVSIHTATTRKGCAALLRQMDFDLTVISEKLADGPGLALLGQIARDSPDTRRVFCARRSRLQLLRGRLGHFGLFRTLAYPIVAREFLATLVLARAGLEVDSPVLEPPRRAISPPRATPPHPGMPLRRAIPPPSALPPRRAIPPRSAISPQRALPTRRAISPPVPKAVRVSPPPRPAMFQQAMVRREPAARVVPLPARPRRMMRPNALLAATLVGVFIMTLILNAPRSYSDVDSDYGSLAVRPPPMPVFRSSPDLTRALEPRPVARRAPAKPVARQVVASTSRVADPSTFGSEAYESIYPD